MVSLYAVWVPAVVFAHLLAFSLFLFSLEQVYANPPSPESLARSRFPNLLITLAEVASSHAFFVAVRTTAHGQRSCKVKNAEHCNGQKPHCDPGL